MNELDSLRVKIEEVDQEILLLFEKRMEIIRKISQYKKLHNVAVVDLDRETTLINKYSKSLKNKDLSIYYHELLATFLKISKDYQKELLIK